MPVSYREKAWRKAISLWLLVGLISWVLWGCATLQEGRSAVDKVDVLENHRVGDGDIQDKIATSSSPRFLGIWDGVAFEYAHYDRFVLQQDIERIERFYRSKGYYEAKVRAVRVIPASRSRHVRVEIVVHEGPATTVVSVLPSGLDSVPFQHQAAVLDVMGKGLKPGQVFDESAYEEAKDRIRAVLMNRGFAWAKVSGRVRVNLFSQGADVQFVIDAGPSFTVRSVTFEGLEDLPENTIRRVFNIEPGDQFSAKKLELGKVALLDLGVLADAQVTWTQPALGGPVLHDAKGQPAVDVVVTCTKAPLRTIKLGIGTELDTIRADIHGVAGWENRNFLGGLRRFNVTIKPGVVLFPTRVGNFEAPNHWLPEGNIISSLRQPGLFEPRATGVLRGNFAVFPVLAHSDSDEVILGYRELKGATGLERPFLDNHLWLGAFIHSQAYYPFTYVGPLDSELRRVFIRYTELIANIDFRDHAIQPHKGVFLGNTIQFAGGLLGGSMSDIKIQPELRLYAPISSAVTLAVRTTVGLLFPRDYGQALEEGLRDTDTRDQQLLYFRAFFSGGPSSNRGYPYRGVGPHGPGAFLAPNLTAAEFREKCGPSSTDEACLIPLGGLTLWEASTEVRFPILGPLTGTVFADASDVTRQKTTFHFEYLHFSTGGGLRYDTPVGPLRLDVGYRVPGMQKIGGKIQREERAPGTIFGAPIAFSIAVGQAF